MGTHGGTGSEVGSRIIISSKDGDDNGAYDAEACVIECREWGTTERQELLLFCGNDIPTAYGADRIRLKGAEILLDTYSTTTSDRTTTSTRLKIDKDGNVGIGTSAPQKAKLHVVGGGPSGPEPPASWAYTSWAYQLNGAYPRGDGLPPPHPDIVANYDGSHMVWKSFQHDIVGIRAEQSIWTEGLFYVSSDQRIKTNIIDVPDELALQQVREIPCRYYEYNVCYSS